MCRIQEGRLMTPEQADRLFRALGSRRLTLAKLAKLHGWHRPSLSNMVNQKSVVSRDVALVLNDMIATDARTQPA